MLLPWDESRVTSVCHELRYLLVMSRSSVCHKASFLWQFLFARLDDEK